MLALPNDFLNALAALAEAYLQHIDHAMLP
jgi:hypothetical protein